MATTTASPLIAQANTSQVFAVTGAATTWVNGVTTFSISGVTGASITSQVVNSTTSATITVSFAQYNVGTLTISNSTDVSTTTATVVNWVPLKDDIFARPNTVVAAAGNQTAIGNNWADVVGNIWQISGGTLKGSGASTTPGNLAVRPISENITAQRIVITRNQNTNSQTFAAVLRRQADTSRYYIFQGGSTLRINRVSSGNVATSLQNNIITVPLINENVTLDVSVADQGGNPVITVVFTNNTTGYTLTTFVQDTIAAKITAAGQCAVDIDDTSTFNFQQVTTYYSNAASAVSSPTGVSANTTNTLISLVGTNTTWTGATTFTLTASGANGATIGTVTFTDATHISVMLTNSGTANDSLVLTDSTNGTKVAISVAAPSIYVSPGSILDNSTGNILTVSGTTQLWLTNPPVFTVGGVAGVSITLVTVIDDTHAQVTVTAGSSTGTVTLSDTNVSYPTSTTFTVIHAIKMNDSNFLISPYNCVQNGAIYTESNYAGSYYKINFTTTGVSALNILYDPAPNIAGGLASSNYPTIGYSLNPTAAGGKWLFQQMQSNATPLTINAALPVGTYQLEIYLKSIRGGTDGGRWNPSCRKARLIGIQVDPSAITNNSQIRRPFNAIFYGNSITQGVGTLGLSSASNDDAFSSWVKSCADGMNAEYGNIGLSGQQWAGSITTIPAFYKASNTPPDTYSWQEANISRLTSGLLTPAPDFIFVNMGTNDVTSGIASNVTSTMVGLRAIAGPLARMFMILPFGGFEQSNTTGIPAGFNAYVAAHPSDTRVYLLNCGSNIAPYAGLNNSDGTQENQYTYDGLHPKAQTSEAFGARVAALAQAAIAGGSSTGTAKNLILINGSSLVHVQTNQTSGYTI